MKKLKMPTIAGIKLRIIAGKLAATSVIPIAKSTLSAKSNSAGTKNTKKLVF